MSARRPPPFLLLPLLACVAACAANSENAMSPQDNNGAAAERCSGANECPPGQVCNVFGYCAKPPRDDGGVGDAGLPPEVEERVEPPASGKRYVYVAVPDQDMVVKIDSTTLAVRTINVGPYPGALRTVAGQDVALVLNRKAASATLLRSRADGDDDVITLPTVEGLNALAVAPDGKHAVAFFDVARSGGTLLPKQSFQEVTLLRLSAGSDQAVNLSVGFRPSDVQFSADSQRAFVITEQGVSIIDLTAPLEPSIVPTVALLQDPLLEPSPTEVLVTPDGTLALLRQPQLGGIRAVDLASGEITDLSLGADASDLDVTADGKLAVVVLRDTKEVAFVDIPDDLADPSGVQKVATTHPVGQATLTADGQRAFLFTNATDQKVLLLASLNTQEIAAFALQKGVTSVRPAPDSRTAVIIHNKAPGTAAPTDTLEQFIDKHHGYSLLALDSGFVKLQLTDAAPGPVAFSTDGNSAYLLLGDRQLDVRSVEAIDLQSFLVASIGLGSHPEALGVVPDSAQVYVAQSHPLGRVTFVDMQTHKTRTLTGFALNSQVIE